MYSTASFDWQDQGQNIIAIIDHDEGRSVRNDIENVIRDIAREVDVNGYRFVYRDAQLMWDGIEVSDGRFFGFISLRTHSFYDALRKIELV